MAGAVLLSISQQTVYGKGLLKSSESENQSFKSSKYLRYRGSHSFPIVIISAEIQGRAHLLVNQSTVLDTLPPESS